MCDPVTGALVAGGLASSIGGSFLNSSANGDVASERSGYMNRERGYQNNLNTETNATNATSRNRYADFRGQQDAKTGQINDFYKNNSGTVPNQGPTTGIIPASSSNLVVQEGKKQNDKVAAFNTQQNAADAKVRSFGDLMGGLSRDVAGDAAHDAILNNFKQGSSSILPQELEAAQSAGAGKRSLSDFLKLGGQVATTAGLSGFGGSAPYTGPTPIRPNFVSSANIPGGNGLFGPV